ncbi:hypothetical protein KAFR_0C05900 [Kazachstania africana CBS 2517]|uniref:BZIP domain-containing protein n=1 Tax=Kazachstania africana (strain ATCC 22294 / BCRC 22015 / CBS 2517 / CECT 1963 / NBRC 1671 / NRRL Y-8276) TaxID=1071382 RepID=H2AT81_KAZAF|nr:hypothetical protein KAFR_0C05900 [Kazachstania africana CBS 2517]CCF57581.1 hypothetical protein KAFR_0C05900 [Kazachstania africana CBS 2517]
MLSRFNTQQTVPPSNSLPSYHTMNSTNISSIVNHQDIPSIPSRSSYTYSIASTAPVITPTSSQKSESSPSCSHNTSFSRLPRVLPPPVYTVPQIQPKRESIYTLNSVIITNNNNNNSHTATSTSPISTFPPTLTALHDSRRHSFSTSAGGSYISKEQDNFTSLQMVRGVHNSNPTTPSLIVKTEPVVSEKAHLAHNSGEKYNDYGQLIGKSGKVLRDTKRAAQNRYAQKAFRLRREKYIKGLEKKAEEFDALLTENSKLKELVEELRKEKELRNR